MITATGFVLALAAAVSFATYSLIARVLAKASRDPLAFSILYGAWSSILAFPIFLFEPWKFGVITPMILFVTFLATVFFAIFQGTEFFSRKHLEASRLTVLFQLTPAITFLGAILLLQESISVEKLAAITLIVGGNIIAIYKHGGHVTFRGLFFGLITVTSLAFAYIADKAAFAFYPLGLYIIITYLMPSLYATPLLGKE